MEYDGNKHTVSPSMRLTAISNRPCSHYQAHETGEPRFDVRNPPVPTKPATAVMPAPAVTDPAARTWWRAAVNFFTGR